MRLRLDPRTETPGWLVYAMPVVAILLTMAAGGALFLGLGLDAGAVLYAFFLEPILVEGGLAELALKATPLTLCAIGLAIGFRANVWNIGAEGQLTIGAICGGGLALALWGEPTWWLLPAMLLAGMLGGAAWAAIPALLKTRFHANEILTSLMLTYIAQLLLTLLVQGPWKDPDGFNFPQSRTFDAEAMLPILIEGTRLHLGALFALAAVGLALWLMARGFIGFQVKVIGLAPQAARFAGFNEKRIVWFCLLLSGALAGLAGMGEVAGPIGQLLPSVSPGYGFSAIIVAFLGRLHPVGILFAAFLLALAHIGGESVQVSMSLPIAVSAVFQGMLLFFLLGCDVFLRYRLRLVRPAAHQAPHLVKGRA